MNGFCQNLFPYPCFADFWSALTDFDVTHVLAVPTMYNYVLATQDPSKIDRTHFKLRYTMTGAAPFSKELHDQFLEKFGLEIREGYGLTESAGMSTGNLNVPNKLGSIGVPLPSQQIEIMDSDNNTLPAGSHGEICIKGDSIMLDYLNQPEATQETIKDGWLHTGDAGYMDEEGYIYMVGRTKEMINRGGENIYPREIECVLEGHPQVAAVAVVGVPDNALGERVKACIIPSAAGALEPQEVKDYLKDKLAKYKIPDYVEFYTAFPMNSTGKVLKYQMKNLPSQ
ncbi:MAG: AMP-binding protein [Bacillota bacterium]|nr:AMP-binding protein [Bacillota bacterium]